MSSLVRACSPVQYGVMAASISACCSDVCYHTFFSDHIVFSSCSILVRVTPSFSMKWNNWGQKWHLKYDMLFHVIFEPSHDKTNKMTARSAKTQISLILSWGGSFARCCLAVLYYFFPPLTSWYLKQWRNALIYYYIFLCPQLGKSWRGILV